MTHILNHQPETGEVQHTQSGTQAGKTPYAQAGAEGVGVENLSGWGQVWSWCNLRCVKLGLGWSDAAQPGKGSMAAWRWFFLWPNWPNMPTGHRFLNLSFQIKLALLDRVGRYPKTKLTHQNPSPEAAESNAIQEVLLVEIPYVMPSATICQSKSLEHGPLHATLKSYKKLNFYLRVGGHNPNSKEFWDLGHTNGYDPSHKSNSVGMAKINIWNHQPVSSLGSLL